MTAAGAIREEEAGFPLQFLYEFGGVSFVNRMLALLEQSKGQRVWRWILGLGTSELMSPQPFVVEFDLVGEIAFRELDYAPSFDGGPLPQAISFSEAAAQFSPFEQDPFDLPAEITAFAWPAAVLSGDRDIRAPRAVAEHITTLIPRSTLLPIRNHGHSALDTQPALALKVTRAAVDSIRASGRIQVDLLPTEPQRKGLMSRAISARLEFARIASRTLS